MEAQQMGRRARNPVGVAQAGPTACRRYGLGHRVRPSPLASHSARPTASSCRGLTRRHAVGSAYFFLFKNRLLICIFFNWLLLYYYSIIIFLRHFCFLGPRSPIWGETLASSTRAVYWYVSNVSIIFDAPCLFLYHLLSVSLHFVAFLCIFRN
jgi:hypothetical protein